MGILMVRHALYAIPLLLVLVAIVPTSGASEPQSDPTVVVVGARSEVHDLTLGTLRRIFRGEVVESPGGDRYHPFNLPASDRTRVRFDRAVLGMTPDQVARYWIDRQIRGLGTSPRAITSAAILCRIVERIPGAIAYVRASQASTGVRVIRISGKAPSDTGYPLAE
jgi:hypothetical protein